MMNCNNKNINNKTESHSSLQSRVGFCFVERLAKDYCAYFWCAGSDFLLVDFFVAVILVLYIHVVMKTQERNFAPALRKNKIFRYCIYLRVDAVTHIYTK